jgi:hypothetical protein
MTRVLPNNLREKLKEPLGHLVNEYQLLQLLEKERVIVSVGDLVTFTCLKNNICPAICIIDYLLKREKYPREMKEILRQFGKKRVKTVNPPGQITDDLWEAIESAYANLEEGPICIEVEGEEDLAALAAIYLAPSDATIIYGLPNKGVVVVKATMSNKKIVKDVLDQM